MCKIISAVRHSCKSYWSNELGFVDCDKIIANEIGWPLHFDKKEFSSNEAIQQGVLAGLGIAMISASTAQNELKDGIIETINLSNLPIIRQWFLINLLEANLDPDVIMFKKFLLENKLELMPVK